MKRGVITAGFLKPETYPVRYPV
ncbi:MAG: hypothetical protein RJB04_1385, partial [Verrucomicrobiota bacterium]